jgi:hypothetical protein
MHGWLMEWVGSESKVTDRASEIYFLFHQRCMRNTAVLIIFYYFRSTCGPLRHPLPLSVPPLGAAVAAAYLTPDDPRAIIHTPRTMGTSYTRHALPHDHALFAPAPALVFAEVPNNTVRRVHHVRPTMAHTFFHQEKIHCRVSVALCFVCCFLQRRT